MRRMTRLLLLACLLASILTAPPVAAISPTLTEPAPAVGVSARHWGVSPRVQIDWSDGLSDPLPGVTYDVRISRTDARETAMTSWRYPGALQGTNLLRTSVPIRAGTTVCAAARRTEGAVTTAWSMTTCATRAFGADRIGTRGPVRIVHRPGLWGGSGLVPRARGRLVVRDVPPRTRIGAIVAYPGGHRSYGFTCANVKHWDDAYPGDPAYANESFFMMPLTHRSCDLRLWVVNGAHRGFVIQGLMVEARWAR